MATTLLYTGLIMNVLGVALGSLRDLARGVAALVTELRSMAKRTASGLISLWRRLLGKRTNAVLSVSGTCAAASGSFCTISVWPAVASDLSIDEKIERLVQRTETLHELHHAHAKRVHESTERTQAEVNVIRESVSASLGHLNERLSDIDDRPVPQRAIGAVLVICGTVLMFLGGVVDA